MTATILVGLLILVALASVVFSDTTKAVQREFREGDFASLPLYSTVKTYKVGWLINVNATGYAKSGADATAERFAGVADQEVEVATGDASGDRRIQVRQKGLVKMTFTSTLSAADLEMAAYVKDNYRAARFADVTYAVFCGIIKGIIDANTAWVDIEPAIPGLGALASAVS
jgi:hypothetical protein